MSASDAGHLPYEPMAPLAQSRPRIAQWLKMAYSLFVAVLVPYYWRAYSPWNFLYFCDIALLMTLVALWTESRMLVSLASIMILFPQTVWVLDFAASACGFKLVGMTGYMFNPELPRITRGLSLFHGWLPFLLVYLLYKMGYDRRAFAIQSCLGVAVLLFCFFVAPRAPAPIDRPDMAININYVWGFDDKHPQTAMTPGEWLVVLSGIFVIGFYLPTHLVLRKVIPDRS